MSDPGERERGLFRDWAVRKQWEFGDHADAGAAATEPAPASEESKADAPVTPEAPPPSAEPAPSPAAAAAPASSPAPAPRDAAWDPEQVSRQGATAPQRTTAAAGPTPGQRLSHTNERGEARMVDVTEKADTDRVAVAEGYVTMQSSTLSLILGGALAKGDVLAVARVAGVMAAKRTSDLIPMCHPLPVTGVTIDLTPSGEGRLRIQATVRTTGKTGVEMEALTAVSVTALTVYDMAKAVDRGMRIEGIRLLEKSGGKSGDWSASQRA